MIPAISTACMYPLPIEEALFYLLDHGIQTVEIFINCFAELEDDFVSMLERRLHESQARLIAIHPHMSGYEPFYFFTTYERRVHEGLHMYERFFRVMQRLDCHYFVFHGDHRHSQFPEELYFERFRLLADTAKRYGVLVLQENVSRCKSADLGFLCRFKEALGSDALFTLDFKQALRSGHTVGDVIDAMGDGIRHIHCSDSDDTHDCLAPGAGMLPLKAVFEHIRRVSPQSEDMCAVIELYRDNYSAYEELLHGFEILERQLP